LLTSFKIFLREKLHTCTSCIKIVKYMSNTNSKSNCKRKKYILFHLYTFCLSVYLEHVCGLNVSTCRSRREHNFFSRTRCAFRCKISEFLIHGFRQSKGFPLGLAEFVRRMRQETLTITYQKPSFRIIFCFFFFFYIRKTFWVEIVK